MQLASRTRFSALVLLIAVLACSQPLQGQNQPAALGLIKEAVSAELLAARTDITPWNYLEHNVEPGKDTLSQVVETPQGDLHRLLEMNGQRLTGSAEQAELNRLRTFVADASEQATQRKNGDADGKQAREFLRMLPTAFFWTVSGENAQSIALTFRPDPSFNPPDSQSKVLSVLAGQIIVNRSAHRIESIRGTLTSDVRFGFGIFGRIDKGGTFNVERRELLPGKWQIVETHVHIGGRALFFKTIGQQQDETRSDWHLSTAPTLQEALEQLVTGNLPTK